MTFDEFWEQNHERIEEACKVDTYGDPTTDRDNKAPISSRAMQVVSRESFAIFQEIGVICDVHKLRRLLEYLVDPGPAGITAPIIRNPYAEASELLKQIERG